MNQGTFSDYHAEDIVNIQNILPILTVGDSFVSTSTTGIFISHVFRQNFGNGLNVADVVGSRLSKN